MRNFLASSLIVTALLALSSSLALSDDIRYYDVPQGALPHDVAPAPDGTVWYTAQSQGALGRLDPQTGSTKQIALGEGSAPHGVIIGPDGAAWVTDGGLNAIVRVDQKTEEVKVFPLPVERGQNDLRERCGSPARTASTAGSIPDRARSRSMTPPGAPAPMASRQLFRARSSTLRSPAITLPASILPAVRPR